MSLPVPAVGQLPPQDTFSIGVHWEVPPSSNARRDGESRRGGRGGRPAQPPSRGPAEDVHMRGFSSFCSSLTAVSSPTERAHAVELTDFTGHCAHHRCFALRSSSEPLQDEPSPTAPQTSVGGPGRFCFKNMFIRCMAVTTAFGRCHGASSLSSRLSFSDAVIISALSSRSERAALHEAWSVFYNSNGLRCGVVYLVRASPAAENHLNGCDSVRNIVSMLRVNFSSAAERLGGVYPTLRVIAADDVIDHSHGQQLSAWPVSVLGQCAADISGEHAAIQSRHLVAQERPRTKLPRRAPAHQPLSLSRDAPVGTLDFPYDVVDAEDMHACRVYIIAKDNSSRRLHVAVLGGTLQPGCRLMVPTASGPGGFLTVSTVECWGRTQLDTHFPSIEVNTVGDSCTSKQRSSFQRGYGVGSVCTVDFRQLSDGLPFCNIPVDTIAGSGLLRYHAVNRGSGSSSGASVGASLSPTAWCDGMFPKRPLFIAVETKSAAQEAMVQSRHECGPSFPQEHRTTHFETLHVSLDSHTFFAVASVEPIGHQRWVLRVDDPSLSIDHQQAAQGCRTSCRRRPPPQSGGISCGSFLPMRPLVARLVSLPPTAGGEASVVLDRYSFVAVIGVQGAGYYLDTVMQCCSWLNKSNAATLDAATHNLLMAQSVVLRRTSGGEHDGGDDAAPTAHTQGPGRCPPAVVRATPMGTTPLVATQRHMRHIGKELCFRAPPFCDGNGAFAFLLNLFVAKPGRSLSSATGGNNNNNNVSDASRGLSEALDVGDKLFESRLIPASLSKSPFFAKWGPRFLAPIICSMVDVFLSSRGCGGPRLNTAPGSAARRDRDRSVLDAFPLIWMDYIIEMMPPENIPTDALPVAAPLLLFRVLRSLDRSTSTSCASNNPATTHPSCAVGTEKQQHFARALVDQCVDHHVMFDGAACGMLVDEIAAVGHRPITWVVSASCPDEGVGSFFHRLVSRVTPSLTIGDIVHKNDGWSATFVTKPFDPMHGGFFQFPQTSAVIPAGWHGVAGVIKLYEAFRMAHAPRGTAMRRPQWEALLLSELFAAEAFGRFAPAALACNAALFHLVLSFCFWG